MELLTTRRSMIVVAGAATVALPVSAAQKSTISAIIQEDKLINFARRSKAELVRHLAGTTDILAEANINTELRIQHFFAQIATETGGFQRLDESCDYSAERLVKIFPKWVTEDEAKILAHRPVAIANHVYGGRLGNGDRSTNDGWLYRGSGFVQLTGRDNFRARGRELNIDLESQPDTVRSPEIGLLVAIGYWQSRKINEAADADDITEVRYRINGGYNGLPDAKWWYATARKFLVPGQPRYDLQGVNQAEEVEAATELLQQLGYISPGGRTLVPFDDVLRSFQKDFGLEETGYLDEDTFYRLIDPLSKFGG